MCVFLKVSICVFIFHCVTLIRGEECVYDDSGLCIEPCPPDTRSYVSPCGSGEAMSQKTCRSPMSRAIGEICDLSRCDCDEPKVWDEAASKCVLLEECSDQSKLDKTSYV